MTDPSSQVSAIACVLNWLSHNDYRLGLQKTAFDHRETKLAARYETSRHLIDICVWDHAYCLDILAFDQATAELVFSEVGPCDNTDALQERLNAFSDWASSLLNH